MVLQTVPYSSSAWLVAFAVAVVALLSTKVRQLSVPKVIPRAFKSAMGQSYSRSIPAAASSQPAEAPIEVEDGELGDLKRLFYQLHHQEKFPQIFPNARDTLLRLLSESLQSATDKSSILNIKTYDTDSLTEFINNTHDMYGEQWNDYIARRQTGAPREMFEDRAAAVQWLKDHAPVKLVDGAWLGHVHRFSAAFETRSITKNAWQIMSEELGDGDQAKNHTFLYAKLLRSVGVDLPNADDKDFVHPRHNMVDLGGWRASVAQLIISLFPKEFLPEILGFNMHFELITWDTLCATKELKELNIDPYYFLLHISIDNAHSGHTAMAANIVKDYLEFIQRTEGAEEVQRVWKRVQAGYVLSECGGIVPQENAQASTEINVWNSHSEKTLKLFQEKAIVSAKLHCTSKARIAGRSLVDWLNAKSMQSTEWARDFLDSLSRSKAWIVPGNSSRSRLVQTLSWKGKMFGAFSDKELQTLCLWIDNLTSSDKSDRQRVYWEFTGRNKLDLPILDPSKQDILVDYPVLDSSVEPTLARWIQAQPTTTTPASAKIETNGSADLDKLMPLWFAQVSLLEGMITIPIKTCDAGMSALIRVVRAQRDFEDCGDGCAGMDEVARDTSTGLHQLGLSMMAKAGQAAPTDLRSIFNTSRDTAAALRMLHMSMRPIEYGPALVGMSWAFAHLHQILGESESAVLPREQLAELGAMAKVEFRCLQEYMNDMHSSAAKKAWSQGFEAAKREIERCFF